MLPPLEHVVVERLLEDRWIDQADDVLESTQAGGLDHGLHPATIGGDTGGPLVALAVQIGPGEGQACVTLVEPGLVVAASTASAGSALGHGSAGPALLLALGRGLLLGLPAYLLFGSGGKRGSEERWEPPSTALDSLSEAELTSHTASGGPLKRRTSITLALPDRFGLPNRAGPGEALGQGNERFEHDFDKPVFNVGTLAPGGADREGVSVFVKDESGHVFHAYSTYGRGIDMLNTAYHYLDLVPKGRSEEGHSPQYWVRRHDEYGREADA